MQTFDTLSEATTALRNQGYTLDFNIASNWVACNALKTNYGPDAFMVDQVHRFEGMSNPDDSEVLYAVSTNDGHKGLIVDAYGAYSEALTPDMLNKLRMPQ